VFDEEDQRKSVYYTYCYWLNGRTINARASCARGLEFK